MELAVVIPALDEADWIAGTVASAVAARDEDSGGSEAVEAVEVVVVDGGSRDATADLAARAGARVIRSAPGRARQIQAGIDASTGSALLILHADTRLAPGYAGALGRALQDPEVAAGAFRIRFAEASPSLRLIEWGARLRVAAFGLPYGDQAIFFRRSTLEAIGGFPQAPIMEDLDLVVALRRQGRMVSLPEPATTSARRYLEQGPFRTLCRHSLALAGWGLGLDRERIARWVRR